jgi:starch synthase (maltosyl-transferring)
MLITQQPTIVQTFLFHANIVGTLAARFRPRPVLVHGMRVADPARWRLAAERWLNRRVDRVACVSQSVADFYAARGRIPTDKLVVVSNGIDVGAVDDAFVADLREIGVPAGHGAITFVGRLHAQKGLDWLLSMMPRLLTQQTDIDLVLVGQGPERKRLESLAGSLGVADRVHFAGWRSDVSSILRASRLLVLPSRWEGMPNVVLEAMAAGTPVVSTRAEGVVELLGDAASQQTAAVGDDEDFVRKLVFLLDNPTAAGEIGQRNRQRVAECFSLDRMVESYQQLYLSLRS